MKRVLSILLVTFVSIGLVACGSASKEQGPADSEGHSVSLFLDWTPNTNHTGFYVAQEKDFYQEAGLNVDILLPGEVSTDQLIGTNKGEFGVSFQSQVTQARGLSQVFVGAK